MGLMLSVGLVSTPLNSASNKENLPHWYPSSTASGGGFCTRVAQKYCYGQANGPLGLRTMFIR